jgi:hypothetical protein
VSQTSEYQQMPACEITGLWVGHATKNTRVHMKSLKFDRR